MQFINCFLIICVCSACVTAEEVCVWETFTAFCSADQVVFIESAFYGRRNNSRCFNVTENETDCSVDIRLQIQKDFGLEPRIQFKIVNELLTKNKPECLNGRMPFLDVSHQCTNLIQTEVCIWESFNAQCEPGRVILIQKALLGRMHSSRCLSDNKELNCYANVQTNLESLCNGRNKCVVKAADNQLRNAVGSCRFDQQPYLEVEYTCVHGFHCPQFTPQEGAKMERTSEGYDIVCRSETIVRKLICQGENWNKDPKTFCAIDESKFLHIMMFTIPAAVLLVSIVSVAILLHRMQKKAQRRRTTAEDEYVDYPESHLRRNGATCNSEYDAYGEIDDGGYASYSEVRDTGP